MIEPHLIIKKVPTLYTSIINNTSKPNSVLLNIDILQNANAYFLIDTGADISVIKKQFINPNVDCYPSKKCSVKGIGNETFETLALCPAKISIDNFILHHSFHIVDDSIPLHYEGILGFDFLNTYDCLIDLKNHCLNLNINNSHITIKLSNPIPENQDYLIPARVEKICSIVLNVDNDGDYFCPSQEITSGVYTANTILTVKNKSSHISIINSNEHPVSIFNCNIIPEPLEYCEVKHLNSWVPKLEKRLQILEDTLNFDSLNYEEKSSILNICRQYNDIFHLQGDKLTTSNFGVHDIPLTENTRPIYLKPYRLPKAAKEEITEQVNKMLENDVIEPSRSPWNSPLLVVPKKSENKNEKRWRVVVDFRKLNKVTIDDVFPLPNIVDILEQLGKSTYFSTLDLADGYYQIPLDPVDRPKTAFSTQFGHYQFTRMPFGLKGAPATFQRIMNSILSGLNGVKCLVYLDDVVVYGYDLQDHNKKLLDVMQTFREFNLKLQPKKCQFLRKEIIYLGHKITSEGVRPDPEKISAVMNFPRPASHKEIKSFLGLCNYYRRFIPNFSHIAEPLNKLLRKDISYSWDAFCEEAFDELKRSLTSYPILQHPDHSKEFIVSTDASNVAIAGILSQKFNSADLPIAFASRVLNHAERNYSTIEKELLAIVWSVKRFRPYLYGRHFTIQTDHRPLTWLHKTNSTSSRLVRWRLDLDEYNYDVVYKPGKQNTNADVLSRIELPNSNQNTECDVKVMTRSKFKASQISDNITKVNSKNPNQHIKSNSCASNSSQTPDVNPISSSLQHNSSSSENDKSKKLDDSKKRRG